MQTYDMSSVQLEIEQWYEKVSEKVLIQSRSDVISFNERIRIYQHDLHKKHIKCSSILKLETIQVLEGHDLCSAYLEGHVGDLLLQPAPADKLARDCLLAEVTPVFTAKDNKNLLKIPDMDL